MWHMYAKRTIGWIIRCPSSRASRRRGKEVRDQPQRDRGRALGTMRTWQCEEIEKGTHAGRASTLGPVERWWTQDGTLWITIQDHPPESGRRTRLLYFTYSYCILSRVWKLAASLLVQSLRHYEQLCLFSILILYVTSSRVCLCLLKMYHSTYIFPHPYTEAHTHTSTHVQSTHKRNSDNQAQEPGWEGQKKSLCYRQRPCTQTKTISEPNRYSRIQRKGFEHIERSKATRLFLI